MDINDSRTPWKDYWATKPTAFRLTTMAIIAGMVAMYSVLGLLAVFGIWRNHLFALNANWPWSFPLAGISLLGRKFNRVILLHCIAFVPLILMQSTMLYYYSYSGVMKVSISDVWYLPVTLVAIAVVNVFAFGSLTRGEARDE